MDLPVRKSLPHSVPQWVLDYSPFFLTINCEPRGRNQLCCAGTADKVLAAARHYHATFVWNCRLMLLMPDHLHAVIELPHPAGLQSVVSNWKKYLSRTASITWQKNFFDHRLRDHHQLIEKLDYISLNPVRKGLCDRIEDWPWLIRCER